MKTFFHILLNFTVNMYTLVRSVTYTKAGKEDRPFIMSYDIGYGSSNNHSPYNKAVDDIQYYISNGWPASKLVLGLPAYGFKPTVGTGTRSYKSIVAEYGSAAAYADEYNGYKYTGINTI